MVEQEKHGQSKLTEVGVRTILTRLQRGESQPIIARDVGVSSSVISRISTGKAWRHVRVQLEGVL